MRLHHWIIASLAFVLANTALAGSSSATLSCHRPGTAFKLEGEITASESALDLRFTDDAGTLHIDYGTHDDDVTDNRFKAGVFTLTLTPREGEDDREMTLRAVPKTMRTKGGHTFRHATFDAVLKNAPKTGQAGDENKGDGAYHPAIRLRCVYDYSI